ncbi:MAG: hypothetical protein IJL11_00915 [Synergistaceae bacterium]|nr:hypothetical protein [Synergistaceae bacterium]
MRKILLPKDSDKMSPVQLALEVALHELNYLHGLHVTDVSDLAYTWDIDTKDAIEIVAKALEPIRSAQHKDNAQGAS